MNVEKIQIADNFKDVLANLQITMRTGLSLFRLESGGGADIRNFKKDDVFFVNQGANEVTVITDKKNKNLIKGKIITQKDSLAMISLKATTTHSRHLPGYVNLFLAQISKEGINLEDIISSYSQVTFVVQERDLMAVFELCNKVKSLQYV